MRILIISNLKKNGYGESTRPNFLSRHFQKKGHRVLNLCDWAGTQQGIRHMRKSIGNPESILIRRLDFFRLLFTTRLFKPDIIYVHQQNNWSWVRLSKALPKAAKIYDAHTSSYLEHSAFGATQAGLETTFDREKNALQEADHIITVSPETKLFFEETFNVAPKKISIVKNATSIMPRITMDTDNPDAFFTCTTILPQDGFESNRMALEMFFDVAQKMEKSNPNIQFRVVGGGNMPLAKSSNVFFTGFVTDLEDELAKANLCLMTYPENAVCGGVRNKVCDFLALGRPIVSTKEGMRGFDDCEDGVHFVKAESVEEFTKEIVFLQENPEKRRELGVSAYEKSKDYLWPKRGDEVETVFNMVLAKNPT